MGGLNLFEMFGCVCLFPFYSNLLNVSLILV